VFLSSIGVMLSINFDYLVVEGSKSALARPVWEAVAMYTVCCFISGFLWLRSNRNAPPEVDFDI
jgi:hypothetical protein